MLAALLDAFPFGVIVLNPKSKALLTNAYASEVLHTSADLEVVNGLGGEMSTSPKTARSPMPLSFWPIVWHKESGLECAD